MTKERLELSRGCFPWASETHASTSSATSPLEAIPGGLEPPTPTFARWCSRSSELRDRNTTERKQRGSNPHGPLARPFWFSKPAPVPVGPCFRNIRIATFACGNATMTHVSLPAFAGWLVVRRTRTGAPVTRPARGPGRYVMFVKKNPRGGSGYAYLWQDPKPKLRRQSRPDGCVSHADAQRKLGEHESAPASAIDKNGYFVVK